MCEKLFALLLYNNNSYSVGGVQFLTDCVAQLFKMLRSLQVSGWLGAFLEQLSCVARH
jgi:hypothetical protein